MAKSQNQKQKLLHLAQYLLRETDEEHGVSIAQMVEYLDKQGISSERKALYNDLDTLRDFGMDIAKLGGRPVLYAVVSRDFELAELKLLVDLVQSSRFITEKKSLSLIAKLGSIAGRHGAAQLQRQVFIRDRVKSMNESIYYNVDTLHSAITTDRQISFRYFDYTVTKEKRFRKEGARYRVSPYALNWDDENYYMIAYDPQSAGLRHYRVDKMSDIAIESAAREGRELLAELDMVQYTKKVFGMFSGTERRVRLRFPEHLAGAVIDRFGRDVILTPQEDGCFTVAVELVVSPQFFGWLCGFGSEVQLLWPEDVRADFVDYTRQILANYT